MKEPPERERPLDAWETREFETIMEGFGRTARRRHRVTRLRPPAAVSGRQVVAVLVVSAVVAGLTATLPSPLNLWGPVVLMAAIMAGCVVWGLRAEKRDGS